MPPRDNSGGAAFQKKGFKPGHSVPITYSDKPKASKPSKPSSLALGKAVPAVGYSKKKGQTTRVVPIPTTWDRGQQIWQLPSLPKIGGNPWSKTKPRNASPRKKAR